MNSGENGESSDRIDIVCPFLGLKYDSATAYQFPSGENRCFHAKPVDPVKFEFQRKYCLVINHSTCQEFNRQSDDPHPSNLHFEDGPTVQEKLRKRRRAWMLFLVVAIIGVMVWQILSRGFLGHTIPIAGSGDLIAASSEKTATQTPLISPTQSQSSPTQTIVLPATSTQVIQTIVPTVRPPHILETPIGLEYNLIIHRVAAGESLPAIANRYWTTVEAIQAVNYYLPIPVMVDWLMVIPADRTDVQGLPVFETYTVTADISVETLAQQFSIDPEMLELYNGLNDVDILHSGEWVLIPHNGTATP